MGASPLYLNTATALPPSRATAHIIRLLLRFRYHFLGADDTDRHYAAAVRGVYMLIWPARILENVEVFTIAAHFKRVPAARTQLEKWRSCKKSAFISSIMPRVAHASLIYLPDTDA